MNVVIISDTKNDSVRIALMQTHSGIDGKIVNRHIVHKNLRRLAEDWIYTNNNALDEFLESFPQVGEIDEDVHCEKWTLNLFKQGDFRIDGLRYKEERGRLV